MSDFVNNLQREIITLSEAKPIMFEFEVIGRILKGPYKRNQYICKYKVNSTGEIIMFGTIYFKVSNVVTNINGRFRSVNVLEHQYKTTLKRLIRELDKRIGDIILQSDGKQCEVKLMWKDWREEDPEPDINKLRVKIIELVRKQIKPGSTI